ncbi:MAG: HesB/YadR/YfhF-family protein [Solirubrobacteraceae bacterium]
MSILVLTISPAASDAIRHLVASTDMPDSAGIRIAAGAETEQGTPLELALVENPSENDEVIADDGASVFVEPRVAAALEDVILDAQVAGDEVAFVLRDDGEMGLPSENGASPG